MVRAEGSAHRGDGDAWRLAVIPDKGNDFFAQIGVKNGLDVAAMKGMRALIVKAEAINGVNGEEFYPSGVNEIGKGPDHALAFELHLVAGGGIRVSSFASCRLRGVKVCQRSGLMGNRFAPESNRGSNPKAPRLR